MNEQEGNADHSQEVVLIVLSREVRGSYVQVATVAVNGLQRRCLVLEEDNSLLGAALAVVVDGKGRPITGKTGQALRRKAKQFGLHVLKEMPSQNTLLLLAQHLGGT